MLSGRQGGLKQISFVTMQREDTDFLRTLRWLHQNISSFSWDHESMHNFFPSKYFPVHKRKWTQSAVKIGNGISSSCHPLLIVNHEEIFRSGGICTRTFIFHSASVGIIWNFLRREHTIHLEFSKHTLNESDYWWSGSDYCWRSNVSGEKLSAYNLFLSPQNF